MPAEPDSLDERKLSAAREESLGVGEASADESWGDAGGRGPQGAAPDSSSLVGRQLAGGDEPEVRLAPHGLRLVAFVVDVLFFAVVFGVGLVLGKFTGPPAWALSVAAGVAFVYYMTATAWMTDGQTAGKAVSSLRVRRIDGTLPSRSRRDLAWSFGRHSVGYLVADVLLLGTVSALFTPRRRCLHDYAFGSEVVLVRSGEEPEPALARCRAFSELWKARHEEVAEQYRWILWPLKWLTAVVVAIASWLAFVANAFAAAPSPLASATPAAKPLSLKGGVALWTATTVASGLVVTGLVSIVPEPNSIRSINVVTTQQVVGRPETAEIYIMKADGEQLRSLTDNGWFDGEADLFADQRIVFTSNRDGNDEIYVMSVDGTGQTRLIEDPASDWCPDWSPDGSRIAFTSNRDGNAEIYVMRADGSDRTRVTDHVAADSCPDWSPDGSRIAFTSDRGGTENVYVMDADGTGIVQLTGDGGGEPQWSPDMTTIAFTSDRDGNQNVYAIDVDGREETRLTDDSAHDRIPFWAPDGSKILFWSERGLEGGAAEVYAMNPDGSDETKLTSFNE